MERKRKGIGDGMILDGRSKHGTGIREFYLRPEIAAMLARRGMLKPPDLSDVATDAEPALARVNPLPDGTARWIAACPDCLTQRLQRSAEYVWLSTPLLLCTACANRDIGGAWRPVKVPANRREIERLLMLRPDPATRGWDPGETLADLQEQNAALGGR